MMSLRTLCAVFALQFCATTLFASAEELIIHEQQLITDGTASAQLAEQLKSALKGRGTDYVPRTVHMMEDGEPAFINRLIVEDSPYLIQHAHNPVNWYPWGPEAFEIAKASDKPIFMSIGYATCHWCHVMERESFESEEIAAILNEHFIAIKVDREQRPDVDATYMSAVQLLTGGGGWPMSTFLTPGAKPFYGGTYFPKDVFADLLSQIHRLWGSDQRPELETQAKDLSDAIAQNNRLAGQAADIGQREIELAVEDIMRSFDNLQGGFSPAPKFPQESKLFLLLDYAQRTGREDVLNAAHFSLQRMAAGGIHDQIAGGFHRYSVDDDWLVPHFEKMLYNQAALSRNYLGGFLLTGDTEHLRVAKRVLNYVLDEMTSEDGGFYSATDADSEGEEGTFFIWSPDELRQILSKDDAELALAAWNVTDAGNFEEKNILHLEGPLKEVADDLDLSFADLTKRLDSISVQLLQARNKRIKPLRDDKLITSWNGMMITALADAGAALNEPRYINAAIKAAHLIWRVNRRSDDTLWRAHYQGNSSIEASQEDYAFLSEAYLSLYDATRNPIWLTRSEVLINKMHTLFWDGTEGGYFAGSAIVGGAELPVRPKEFFDNATPTGNAVALRVMSRLWYRTGKPIYKERAEAQILAFSAYLSAYPSAFGYMLGSVSELLSGESGASRYVANGNARVKAHVDGSKLRVRISMGDEWHINARHPNQDYLIETKVMRPNGDELKNVEYPKALTKVLDFEKTELALYEGDVQIVVALSEKPDPELQPIMPVSIQLQACNNTVCLPPETIELLVPTATVLLSASLDADEQ